MRKIQLFIYLFIAAIPTTILSAIAIKEGSLIVAVIGLSFGSFFAFAAMRSYRRMKDNVSDEACDEQWNYVPPSHKHGQSQSNFDQTFSPCNKIFAQNIYHNRRY